MLSYTTLFAELEALYASAGRDPASFRRLAREVKRVRRSVEDVAREMSTDYVGILLQRLSRGGEVELKQEEAELLRGFLGLPPADPEREQRLLAELEEIEETLKQVLSLRDQPLRPRHLEGLRQRLTRLEDLLEHVVAGLELMREARRFDRAAGLSGEPVDAEWLARTIRRSLEGSDLGSVEESEEVTGPFAGR